VIPDPLDRAGGANDHPPGDARRAARARVRRRRASGRREPIIERLVARGRRGRGYGRGGARRSDDPRRAGGILIRRLAWGFAGAIGFFNPTALLLSICLLLLAANSPELLAGGMARVGLGALVEAALLAARVAAPALPAAAAGAGPGAARVAGRTAGSGGATVPAAAVPRVMASPIAVSGQSSGTGGGTAVEHKSNWLRPWRASSRFGYW